MIAAEPPADDGQTAAAATSIQPPKTWGPETNGWSLALTTVESQTSDAKQLSVRVWHRNGSNQIRVLERCGFWPNHQLLLTDEEGQEMRRTELGQMAAERFTSGERRKSFEVEVPSGGIDGPDGPYDLREHFELPSGCRIRVQCVWQAGAAQVRSNVLELLVPAS